MTAKLIAVMLLAAFVSAVFWNYGTAPAAGDDLDCSGPILLLTEIRCWNLDGKWDN